MAKSEWVAVCGVDEVAAGALKAVRAGAQALVLARDGDEVHAVEGRCPHEGYPLATGDLAGCTLTCSWHNWKFDLRDGSCILGGEGLRRFATRVRDGKIEVDVAEPDPQTRWPALIAGVERAIVEGDASWAIRDAIRAIVAGYDPARLLADVAAVDARRAEYGCSHVAAVAADCARLASQREGVDTAFALAPAIDLCAEEVLRLPEREVAESTSEAPTEEALIAAVEAEDGARAEGVLRAAFDRGVELKTIERWLYAATSLHFTSFGHQLIYLVKLQELIDRAGAPYAPDLYRGLLRSIILGTREDTLPYMRLYRDFARDRDGRLAEVDAGSNGSAPFDRAGLIAAVLDGTPRAAMEAVWGALESGVSADRIASGLVIAGATRLLRFDPAIDADPGVAENWLWATHRFTFASAVRNAVARFDDPRRLRFLFQAVAFIHSGHKMDGPVTPVSSTGQPGADGGPTGVLAAIAAHRADDAVSRAAQVLRTDDGAAALQAALQELCLRDPLVRPIFVAHALKTTVAAFEERAAQGDAEDRDLPVLAAVRFLASPQVERRVHATVAQSIRFVRDGEMPRKLTQ